MRLVLSACSILLLAACSNGVASDPAVAVKTALPEYALPAGGGPVTVDFAISNGTLEKIYVTRCGGQPGVVIQRDEGGAWKDHASSACPTVLPQDALAMNPTSMAAGELRVGEPGTYRFQVLYTPASRDALERATSNTFTVR